MATITGFGTAPEIAAEGYKLKKTVEGTDEAVLAQFDGQDVKLVRGAAIFGRDGHYEFALVVRR